MSVVVALHQDGPQIADTLDSVAGSWMREFELVVVDAGSHDGSLAIAERWIGEYPRIPATLIDDRNAQGRGAARNTALDFARGDAILVLDAGGAIYSHCLQRLADTLAVMDDVAFVYPMIEVRLESDWFVRAGGDNLLNVFGWEPERLRSGNFIQAPYLVRLGALRSLVASRPTRRSTDSRTTTSGAESPSGAGGASCSRSCWRPERSSPARAVCRPCIPPSAPQRGR